MTEMILTSSVLILLLAILRRALRGRISPTVQYALWLLAAARLLIPGTLFPAPVSVVGAAEELRTSLHETFPDPDNLPEPAVNGIIGQLPQQDPAPAVPPDAVYPETDVVVNYQTIPLEPEITRKVYNWPDIIWKTGMAVTGGALLVSNLVFYLRLRKNRKLLTLPDALWSGKLPVYEAEAIPSPCLFGLLRPAVYLNEAAMGVRHPEHILAHEYAHYRHGDHLWSILRGICLVIHWYNPLVWWAAALSRRDGELACDAAALRRLGEEARIDYGQTLLGMVSRSRNPAALLHTATTMTAGKRAVKERIALIVKQPRMRKITLVLVAALSCLLAVCTFGGKAEAEEPPGTREPSEVLEMPAAVYLGEMLSSQYRPGPVTDPDIVSRLWELYQGFEFDGTAEEFTRDNVWSVTASFRDETGNEMAHFTIWAGGLCWLEDDYETFHVLRNGQAIYEEFRDCCRTAPRDENDVPAGTDGTDVLDEVLARLDALHGEKAAVYHYTSKCGAPSNGTLTASELSALEEAFRACRWTKPSEHPAAEYIVWDIRESSFELMGDYPYWEKVTVGPFTFYDGHPYVLYDDGETIGWYYVPEGWVTVQAALIYAADKTCTLAEKKGLYLYMIARNVWDTVQFGQMYERYSGVSETEEGNLPCVGFFESIADFRGYLETMFSLEITEYLMNIPTFVEYGGRLRYLPADCPSNIYAGRETYHAFPLSAKEAAQYGYNGHIFARTPVLDKDLETVLGYKRHDFFYVWNGTHYVFTNFGPYDDVDPQVYYNAEEIAAQVQRGADAGEWLPLMSYMDWQAIARAAVNAGMDDGDGSLAVVENVMGAIDRHIDRKGGEMTMAEYLDLLSATEGLDGAPAEGYAYTLYRLYVLNPSRFAYVVLERLPEARRNEALDLFRGEWYFHTELSGEHAPSREAAIAQLEADLAGGVSVSPSEMTFTTYKQGSKFAPPNMPRDHTATFTSSNLAVASVDPEGLVWAEGPGEAVVTMHYLDASGPREYTCLVHCDWDDTESVGLDDALYRQRKEAFRLYGDEIAAWQQRYESCVANAPAAPASEVSFDGSDLTDIKRKAAIYLQDYYNAYFSEAFAQDSFTGDKETYCEVYVSIYASDLSDLTQVPVEYSIRVVPAVSLPNGYQLSDDIQMKYGLTTTLSMEGELFAGP